MALRRRRHQAAPFVCTLSAVEAQNPGRIEGRGDLLRGPAKCDDASLDRLEGHLAYRSHRATFALLRDPPEVSAARMLCHAMSALER